MRRSAEACTGIILILEQNFGQRYPETFSGPLKESHGSKYNVRQENAGGFLHSENDSISCGSWQNLPAARRKF